MQKQKDIIISLTLKDLRVASLVAIGYMLREGGSELVIEHRNLRLPDSQEKADFLVTITKIENESKTT
jgi:hypothetical protein